MVKYEPAPYVHSTMLHDDNLDDSAMLIIDTIIKYNIVAEQCTAHLRKCDQALASRLWDKLGVTFQANSVKYPSVMVAPHETEGRNQFQEKCQALCFPPESQRPCHLQECVSYSLNPSLLYNLIS